MAKTVGIIAANNIRYSPYIMFYASILDDMGISYELITLDRHGEKDIFRRPVHTIAWDTSKNTLWNHVVVSGRLKTLLEKQKYDYLIVLTTGNAVSLAGWLKKHYPGRYIVDVRDYTYERYKPYYWLEKKALYHSDMNVISSRKFESFLPAVKEYYVCHNLPAECAPQPGKKTGNQRIRIGYVGSLGYEAQCKKMIDLVNSDDRFEFFFYGTSALEPILKEYAPAYESSRIRFFGRYDPKDKAQIVKSVDILFNVYGNGVPLLDCALSNKLYDALIFKKPILTSPHTYMEEMGGALSYSVDLAKTDTLEQLYQWYQHLDWAAVEQYAEQTLARITAENEHTVRTIKEHIAGSLKMQDACAR